MTVQTAAEIWRRYDIAGVPAPGTEHKPSKAEIIVWGTLMEVLRSGSGLAFGSKALLLADLVHAANVTALVYNDATPANNGQYQKTGASGVGAWARVGDLPTSVVRLTVTGGTANAIIATATETPLLPGNKLYLLTPTANNTAAVTINGTAVKNALGSSLAANSLLNDSPVLMAWSVDHYQILVSVPVDATGVLADALAARDAASGYSVAAASSASALGNQVHQYDTRALAIAATIPVGVLAIKVTRYATGYPLSYATYIPGTSGGPMAFQEAAGHWWELDVTGGFVVPEWFGAKSDDSNDDYSAIIAAQAVAVSASTVLFWLSRTYKFGTPLNLSTAHTRHFTLGRTNLHFIGTGVAITFDGGASGPGNGLYNVIFGSRDFPFRVVGNPNCTKLVYCRATHQCSINFIGRECSSTALAVDFAVTSKFYVKCSTNGEGAMTTLPNSGLILGRRGVGEGVVDCELEVIAEGLAGTGITMQYAQLSRFTGTSEGNGDGGVYEGTGCERNVWERMDCESNVGADFFCNLSSQTQLINCGGGSLIFISAARFQVTACEFATISTDGASLRGHFQNVHYTTTWAMLSLTCTWKSVYDGAGLFLADRPYPLLNYASLPTPAVGNVEMGAIACISDATTNTWGATVSAGGGANSVMVRWNGAAWTVVGK